jgi:succinate dehydrogenase / fumarate reductase, cytochrome b subunit
MSALLSSLLSIFRTSIGRKFVVAITGLLLVLFLLGHLAGNLLIYLGPDAINAYGDKLHSLGPGLWLIRAGLLAIFVIHIVSTIQLARENRAARPGNYALNRPQRSSLASRTMILSGLTVLAFVAFHLAHFTLPTGLKTNLTGKTLLDGKEVTDVYSMMVDGFLFLPSTLFYVVGISLLCAHLSHGVASLFQTLGWTTPRTWPAIKAGGISLALLLWAGFLSIPLMVLLGVVKPL